MINCEKINKGLNMNDYKKWIDKWNKAWTTLSKTYKNIMNVDEGAVLGLDCKLKV